MRGWGTSGRRHRDGWESSVGELIEEGKPRLRGWLHAGMAPLVLAAGIVLVALAPAGEARAAAAVYAGGDGANLRRARRKVAKIHARIADRRCDHLHKLTTRLVRENQTLVIEDLTVRNMVRNRSLARAISDAAWAEFRSLLEYRATWYGREVIAVDRFFPSSRLCSACGTLQENMPLSVRTWTCDSCGTAHDRDVNAAKNLLAAGLAASVCGAGVRPQRRIPGGQSATKQKTPRREPWESPRSQGEGSQPVDPGLRQRPDDLTRHPPLLLGAQSLLADEGA